EPRQVPRDTQLLDPARVAGAAGEHPVSGRRRQGAVRPHAQQHGAGEPAHPRAAAREPSDGRRSRAASGRAPGADGQRVSVNRFVPPERWEGDDAPPDGWSHLPELAWNLGRLIGAFRKRGPRGPNEGQPVLVIPGFLCGDQTTFSLRRELARAGFRVHGWKQGWNMG